VKRYECLTREGKTWIVQKMGNSTSVGWMAYGAVFFARFEACERGGKGREKGEKVGLDERVGR